MGDLLTSIKLLFEGSEYFLPLSVPEYRLSKTPDSVWVCFRSAHLGNCRDNKKRVEIKHTASARTHEEQAVLVSYLQEVYESLGPFAEKNPDASSNGNGNDCTKSIDSCLAEIQSSKFKGAVVFNADGDCSKVLKLERDHYGDIAIRVNITGPESQVLHYVWAIDCAIDEYFSSRTLSELQASRPQALSSQTR